MHDALELAIAATLAAGEGVMRAFGTVMEVRHKSPDQPLTEADLEADRLLRQLLLDATPDCGWLSEETADNPERLTRERLWVVDPIDGTRSFIANRPEFSISVALVENGDPVVGVIHNPATGELYWAVRGAGAWRREGDRDRRISCRTGSGEKPVMLASRSEIARGEFDAFREEWSIEPLGSTAYKMARVAAGHADAFLSRGPKSEWDVCAGVLILEEAGAVVTDARGRAFSFNRPDPSVTGVLAATPEWHARIFET